MGWKYQVARGCSVMHPMGVGTIPAGTDITPEIATLIGQKNLRSMQTSGFIIPVVDTAEPMNLSAELLPASVVPGAVPVQPLPNMNEDDKDTKVDRETINVSGPVANITSGTNAQPPSTLPPVDPSMAVNATSKWTMDPAGLAGKPLAALNVMVAERDTSVSPFTDPAEAIAFLSRDFRASSFPIK